MSPKEKILSLMNSYKKNQSALIAKEICDIYSSLPRAKSKILGNEYGRVKVFVWKLRKKYLKEEDFSEPKEKFTEKFNLKASSSGKTNAIVNLSYRLQKFKIRKYLLELVKDKSPVEALTLPGTEWIFERDLIIQQESDCLIVGLENDPAVYRYSQLNMPPNTKNFIQYLNLSDEDFFKKKKHPYKFDIIWLDYMGPFSMQRLKVFELAVKNGYLKDDCILALTFLCGRENREIQKIYKKYVDTKENFHEARKIAIPDMYRKIAEKYGFKTQILKVEIYKEEQGNCKTVPMIFVAFKLTSNK